MNYHQLTNLYRGREKRLVGVDFSDQIDPDDHDLAAKVLKPSDLPTGVMNWILSTPEEIFANVEKEKWLRGEWALKIVRKKGVNVLNTFLHAFLSSLVTHLVSKC